MRKEYAAALKWMKFVCACSMIVSFGYVWLLYYNDFAFQANWLYGALASVALYVAVYLMLARLYEAFNLETCQIGEIIFSQALSFGIANLVLYLECCLIHVGAVDVLPGVLVFILQMAFSVVFAVYGKRYLMYRVKPYKTILISRELRFSEAQHFRNRLETKLYYLFDIQNTYYCRTNLKKFPLEEIETYEAVLLYEVPANLRSRIFAYCVEKQKIIYVTPRLDDIFLFGFENSHVLDTPLMRYGISAQGKRTAYLSKRFWDIVISVIMLIIFSPFIILTAAAVKMEDGGPVFFRQKRLTLHGREFEILKFRSMIVDAEKAGEVIPCKTGDRRITRVGHLIRATRLDELPQLWNILKGDMSIIGPRPERVEHMEKYMKELPEFSARLQVRGGLTGYAQVFGKYNTTAEDKLKMDLMYIENMSLWMDMKILFLTVKTMFIPEKTEGFGAEETGED